MALPTSRNIGAPERPSRARKAARRTGSVGTVRWTRMILRWVAAFEIAKEEAVTEFEESKEPWPEDDLELAR